MPAPGWEYLLTPGGLTRLAEVQDRKLAGESSDQLNTFLRTNGEPPAHAAALLTQLQLRTQAQSKFGARARQMLFTRAGLEQATRGPVAALHAARFARAGVRTVADLGCGIGAESQELRAAGLGVRAVERDPFTAQLAKHNVQLIDSRAAFEVLAGDAEVVGPGTADAVFFDPARRTSGHHDTRRLTSSDDYSPGLPFIFETLRRLPGGVKLGPGFHRANIPDDAEAQWVSVAGQLVETGLWFGACARPGVSRAALVMSKTAAANDQNDTSHRPQVHELTAAADARDAAERLPGEYLYEPDGTVIRARLIGLLAEHIGAGMLSEQIAYLTSDTLVHTPFAQSFRITDEVPVRTKELRRTLAARGIGTLEIKKRGVDVDPAVLRKQLALKGPHSATLFLTRSRGVHTGFLAERITRQ